MKKAFIIFAALFIAYASIGYFFAIDKSFRNELITKFGNSAYITAKPANIKKGKKLLQKTAKDCNVNFAKEEIIPTNGITAKQKINIYLHLSDAKRFEEKNSNIRVFKNKDGALNQFAGIKKISLLTTKKIKFISYDSINNNAFVGDYRISGSKTNIDKFVNRLNSGKAQIQAKLIKDPYGTRDVSNEEYLVFWVLYAILLAIVIFSVGMSAKIMLKEASVVVMLGHSKNEFCVKNALKSFLLFGIISFVLVNIIIATIIMPSSLATYISAVTRIYIFNFAYAVAILVLQIIVSYVVFSKIKPIYALKGYAGKKSKLIVALRAVTIAIAMCLLSASIFHTYHYVKLQPELKKWEKSKNYVNIGMTWSHAIDEGKGKIKDDVPKKIDTIWDKLDERGALLFKLNINDSDGQTREEIKQIIDTEEEPFEGDYAYINSNYLKYANILGKNGKPLNISTAKKNEWVILVPNSITVSKRDKHLIRDLHSHEIKDKKKNVRERYVRIQNSQALFTFDSRQKIDIPNVKNFPLILVNGKDLSPYASIKESSLLNGNFHPKVKNYKNAYEEISPIIDKAHAHSNVLFVSSVYSEVADNLGEIRSMAIINAIAFLLALIILIALIKLDLETYFIEHGRRIDVSRLLGYNFFGIHSGKIYGDYYIYLASVVIYVALIVVSEKMINADLFRQSEGWNGRSISVCLGVAIISMIVTHIFELIGLKRGDKEIVTRLKE